MKKSILSFLMFGAVLSAAPVSVTFVNPGNPLVVSNGVYVGPYTLTVNGVTTPAMCVDDFLEVHDGDKWSANETLVNSSNFSNTYLGNGGKTIEGTNYSSSDIYKAEAYLFSLITKPGADRSDIQEAAWAIMDTNTLNNVFNTNDTGVENYVYAAANNYSSFDASGYRIISQAGVQCEQEFMVASAPEPASFALFGGALLLAGAARFGRRRKQVQA